MCFTLTKLLSSVSQAAIQRVEGRVSVTSDGWTSPNQKAFVAFVAHYVADGEMKHLIMDVVDVAAVSTNISLVIYPELTR